MTQVDQLGMRDEELGLETVGFELKVAVDRAVPEQVLEPMVAVDWAVLELKVAVDCVVIELKVVVDWAAPVQVSVLELNGLGFALDLLNSTVCNI